MGQPDRPPHRDERPGPRLAPAAITGLGKGWQFPDSLGDNDEPAGLRVLFPMTRLGNLWRGNLPLDIAFWNWAVIGGLVVNLTTSLLFLLLIMAEYPIVALVVGYGFSVPYNILAVVAVWRAAGRYDGPRHWADLARLVTVAGMVLLSIT
jgi:hypothetical protein